MVPPDRPDRHGRTAAQRQVILTSQKRKIDLAKDLWREAIKLQRELNKDYGSALTNAYAKVAVLAIAMLFALNAKDTIAIDIITAANIAALSASAGFAFSALIEWQETAALCAKAGWLVERANKSYDHGMFRDYYDGLNEQPAGWFARIQEIDNAARNIRRGHFVGRTSSGGRVYLLRKNRSVSRMLGSLMTKKTLL